MQRLLVHEAVYDEFVEKLVKATADLTVGNGAEDGVIIGPLVNKKAVSEQNWDAITETAQKFVAAVKQARRS